MKISTEDKERFLDALNNVAESAEWASRHGDDCVTREDLSTISELFEIIRES